jgi:membrane-bound serine protease (ClpP class)
MLPLAPDAAIVCLTLGVALIYWELNRPGGILPGALGLLLFLYAISAFNRAGLQPTALVLVVSATVLLALGLRYPLPAIVSIASTSALILGLYLLVRLPFSSLHAATSLLCGLFLGTASARLVDIARLARRNKRSARGKQRLD